MKRGRLNASSEPESFSDVLEQRAETHLIQAQSAAIALAMASICNNEQGCFGVMSGHERKTLRLSGQQLFQLAAFEQLVQVISTADQRAFDKYHRKSGQPVHNFRALRRRQVFR